MSMRLKKGQTAFKPKVKVTPRNRPGGPGSAQSSARPSVERQSQTPAPTTRPTDTITIPDHNNDNDIPRETSIEQSIPQPTALETSAPTIQYPNLSSELPSNTNTTENAFKRKAGDKGAPEPVQKRARVGLPESSKDVEISDVENTVEERRPLPGARLTSQNQILETDQGVEDRQAAPTLPSFSTQNPPPEIDRHENPTHGQVDSSSSADQEIVEEDNAIAQSTKAPATAEEVTASPSVDTATTNRRPEIRQDDPSSIYPDPELSGWGVGRPSNIFASTALNPDGSIAISGETVPTATLNPDGTPAIRAGNLVPAAALNPDGTPRDVEPEPASQSKKAGKKRRRMIQAPQEGDDVRPTIEMQINRMRRTGRAEPRPRTKKERPRKKRARTPEGAENEIVDRTAMTIGELCKDIRIGTKSSNHDMIQNQIKVGRERVKQRRLEALAAKTAREEGGEGATQNTSAQTIAQEEFGSPEHEDNPGPQMRLIGDQLVLDDRSLHINYNQRANAKTRREPVIIVRENEFSKLVTSGSNMKREQPQPWDAASTTKFYKAIRMFGTDFEMIAKMFPDRNRRQVKLKFTSEERKNRWKLDRALMGEKDPIDLDKFNEYSTDRLEDISVIEGELREIEEQQRKEEEEARFLREEDERLKRATIRQRRDNSAVARRALDGISDDENRQGDNRGPSSGQREASAAPKTKKKGPMKKQKKNIHGVSMNPDNYSIVGHVDDL